MRKLATIRRIDDLQPIQDADKIELAIVGGWKVVVKKDEFSVDDLVIYCEIDSWIPHKIAPFLTKSGHHPKIFEGVEGERLKTIRLRKTLSQGLILPIDVLGEVKKDGDKMFVCINTTNDSTQLNYEVNSNADIQNTKQDNG